MQDYWNRNVLVFGGENQKKKFLASSPVEALILFNEEYQGLLKLRVPLGWDWGRMELGRKGGAISKRVDYGAGFCWWTVMVEW